MTLINIIATMDPNRVIGRNNDLPWFNPKQEQYTNNVTNGHVCITGRRTFESMIGNEGKPSYNRQYCVLSHYPHYTLRYPIGFRLDAAMTLESALNHYRDSKEVFIIGGGTVFEQALPLANKLYLSIMKQTFDGDTIFPVVNATEYDIITVYEDHVLTRYEYVKRT